jgi:O-antigen/teichoic acid export membrane protein
MSQTTRIFHLISYLQYPLMLAALAYYVPFVMSMIKKPINWSLLNQVLILMGVSLSFSTLQDTSKTQNKLSKKIWQDPKKGKIFLWVIAVMAMLFIITGLLALLLYRADQTESVAVGITVLGIGMLGMLKAAIEMFENHRLDKNK